MDHLGFIKNTFQHTILHKIFIKTIYLYLSFWDDGVICFNDL